eukprot:272600-Prymnesium_polylepis.1
MADRPSRSTTAEALLILNGGLRKLLSAQRWEDAGLVGKRALEIAEHHVHEADEPALAQVARLGAALAPLGVLGDRERLSRALVAVLRSSHVSATQRIAVDALRTATGSDLQLFLSLLPPPDRATPALFEALIRDTESAPAIFHQPGLESVMVRGLGAAEAVRAEALALAGKLVLTAPVALAAAIVPILTTAALHESGEPQVVALAALSDTACLLARSSAEDESAAWSPGPAEGTAPALAAPALASIVELLQSFLYAPSAELQH